MSDKVQVSIRNLYKIFGTNPQEALRYVLGGMSKADLLKQHGHVLGLKDINVDIKEGEITVIMGLSGSGKSTLIRHLNRLIEPTSGEVFVDGDNVLDYGEDKLRELRRQVMSMVFQKFALLPHRTVAENAGTTLGVRGVAKMDYLKEADKWLDRVGLRGFGNHYPHQLSGGMQQRVGIARALTSNSPIMLMDEAFSALDPLIRTDMQDLLLELQKELHKTIVFITHDLDEALKLADHEDNQKAIEAVKRLQALWKATGPALRKEEPRLWRAFRAGCDALFEKRQQQAEALKAEHEVNKVAALVQ